MNNLMKAVRLAIIPVALCAFAAGCGGSDNDKTMMTNTDGTSTKVEGGGGGPSTADEYNKKAQAEFQGRSAEQGYPGAKGAAKK